MPRSGGIYSLPPGYFATDGTTIEVSQHNPPLEDIAQALTDSLPRDGSAPMTGNLAMGSNKITGLAAGTNPSDAARFDQVPNLTGLTATVTELNYTDGVTSPIQTQLDAKQAQGATLTSLEGLSLAAGDILYATAADTLARLPIGTAGQSLVVNTGATAPEWVSILRVQTPQSASSAVVDFSGIPSWAKRITVMLRGVSTSGNSALIIQIGDGAVETTGYAGGAGFYEDGPSVSAVGYTSGFGLNASHLATHVLHGAATITQFEPGVWVCASSLSNSSGTQNGACMTGSGTKQITGNLARLRVTTVGGTDTFDAGSINISWE